MTRRTLALLLVCLFTLLPSSALAQKRGTRAQAAPKTTMTTSTKIATVLEPSRSPLVSFRILFMTGSASDPAGKEGVASLTAAMLAQGGSRALSYDQIVEAMYPLATSFGWQTDKEMTVFSGTTHADNLEKYYGLIRDMLLDPGFRDDDFARLKEDAINFLKVSLRQGNDEELGKEYLYNIIYAGHPYGHHNIGAIGALEKLTLDDVRSFYKQNYTQSALVVGLAGGYPSDFPARVESDFSKLPAGAGVPKRFSLPRLAPGMRVEIIQRETRATAISMRALIPKSSDCGFNLVGRVKYGRRSRFALVSKPTSLSSTSTFTTRSTAGIAWQSWGW